MKKFKLPKFDFRKFLRLLIAFVIGCNTFLMAKNAIDGDINLLMLRLNLIIWMGLYLVMENRINSLLEERDQFEEFLLGAEKEIDERMRSHEKEIQELKDEVGKDISLYKSNKESRF